jgi:hypothetical protein
LPQTTPTSFKQPSPYLYFILYVFMIIRKDWLLILSVLPLSF